MSERYKFHNQEMLYFITPTIVQWCDIFTRDCYKNIFVDSVNSCIAHKRLRVHARVLMTNHAHMIISTEGEKLEDIMRDLKKYTAKAIFNELKNNGRESRIWLSNIFQFEGRKNPHNTCIRIWQQQHHPIKLRDGDMLRKRFRYPHDNPVRAGFVAQHEHWIYSSAIDYAGGKGLIEVDKIILSVFDM